MSETTELNQSWRRIYVFSLMVRWILAVTFGALVWAQLALFLNLLPISHPWMALWVQIMVILLILSATSLIGYFFLTVDWFKRFKEYLQSLDSKLVEG